MTLIVSITKLKTFSFIIRTIYFKGSFSISVQNYTLKKTLHVRSFEKTQKIFIFLNLPQKKPTTCWLFLIVSQLARQFGTHAYQNLFFLHFIFME